jgi:hypothetical protein
VLSGGGGGGFLPATYISINGSDPILVSVDTGTSGLVLDPDAIQNPTTPVVNTDVKAGVDYDGTGLTGFIAHGTFTIQGVSTEHPVAFINGTECTTPECPGGETGTVGVLGVGPEVSHYPGGDANSTFAAINQLPGTLKDGFTIDFTGASPHLRLGPIGKAGAQDTVVQRTQKDSEVKPNGQKVFIDPTLCWSITAGPDFAQACNTTVLDTGQTGGVIHGAEFDPVVDPSTAPPIPGSGIQRQGWVKTGATVTWSASPTDAPFAGVTQGDSLPIQYGLFTIAPGIAPADAIFNAGNHFYTQHAVGFDSVSGSVIIGPTAGLPTAPGEVVAAVSDGGAVSVGWNDSTRSADADATTNFVVSAVRADGTVVQSAQTSADARELTVAGLVAGASYTFRVGAVNDIGLGPVTESDPVALPGAPATPGSGALPDSADTGSTSELAATGDTAAPIGTLGAVFLVLAGAAALGVARFQRAGDPAAGPDRSTRGPNRRQR